ncbi:MAG: hypothetical protein A2X36_10930 [Elusimicrobia bacterium GWA2_69_24]|nr:MAG: hypothetical protein A2X36_10930 [Elusimicrobia bacterium GWA2_69_24]
MIAVLAALAGVLAPWPAHSEGVTYELTQVLKTTRGTRRMAFGPGASLVSFGDGRTLTLWDVEKGTQLGAFDAASGRIRAVAVAPNGKTLAAASDDRNVTVIELGTGRALQTLEGIAKGAGAVAFSPDNGTVASGDDGGNIDLFSAKFGKAQGKLKGHEGRILALAFSPDGAGLISASDDKSVRLWDVVGRKERRNLSESQSRYGDITAVAFSAASDVFAMGLTEVKSNDSNRRSRAGPPSWNYLVKLRSASTGDEVATLSGHSQEIVAVAVDGGGRLAASGSKDRTIRLWDAERKSEVASFPQDSDVLAVALSRDGRWLAGLANNGSLSVWELKGLKPLAVAALPKNTRVGVQRAAAEADLTPALPPSPVLAKYKSPLHEDDFALVIGIENYNSIPKADNAERDAAAVVTHMEALGVPRRNIIHLAGPQASYTSFKKYLESWLPKNVKSTSRVFFFYSGHGAPDPKTGEAFLVPWDGDPAFLSDTAFPVKRLYKSLAALPAKEVIVALDACFSGAGGRSVLAQGARPLVNKVDIDKSPAFGRIALLTAASANEITSSVPDAYHGMFTYFLLKGLNGEAKDKSGNITTQSLFDYLGPHVQDEARRQNREQTPTYNSDQTVGLR